MLKFGISFFFSCFGLRASKNWSVLQRYRLDENSPSSGTPTLQHGGDVWKIGTGEVGIAMQINVDRAVNTNEISSSLALLGKQPTTTVLQVTTTVCHIKNQEYTADTFWWYFAREETFT